MDKCFWMETYINRTIKASSQRIQVSGLRLSLHSISGKIIIFLVPFGNKKYDINKTNSILV